MSYTGAGALAMMVNGVSMYPIMSPGVAAIDEAHKWRDGHIRGDNMKLDGQLDSCNEHAGRGFDIHYHADPVCMYNDTRKGHSQLIGWAADGFPLFGKYNSSHEEPDDLDRCNGHFEDVDGDGSPDYHYHVSPRFPYTIACWRGNLSDLGYEHGGQPGQEQWAFDNARTRSTSDVAALLPCCNASTDPEKNAPLWVEAMRPFSPVDDDNRAYEERAERLPIQKTMPPSWMFATHSHWDADRAVRDSPIGRTNSANTQMYVPCTGNSSALAVVDCRAWQDLFDATAGEQWDACTELRADPCSCLAATARWHARTLLWHLSQKLFGSPPLGFK